MNIKRNLLAILMSMAATNYSFAEVKIASQDDIGVNPLPHPDSMLEVESSTKGLLIPRVALTSTTSPSPLSGHVEGMVVFNTASTSDVIPCVYHNNGEKWVSECEPGTEWYEVVNDEESDALGEKDGRIARHGPVGINDFQFGRVEKFLPRDDLEIHSRNPAVLLNDINGNAFNTGIFWTEKQRPNFGIHSDHNDFGYNLAFANYYPTGFGDRGGFKWIVQSPDNVANGIAEADGWFPGMSDYNPNKVQAAFEFFGQRIKDNGMITAMRLENDGHLEVMGELTVNSDARFETDVTVLGTVTQSSDERLKKDMVELDNVLAKISEIEPVYFKRIADINDELPREIGFKAQNVEKVFPELVHTNEETGLKAVAYANMTPVLVKAMQELTAEFNQEIAALKKADVALRQENEALKSENAAIKLENVAIKNQMAHLNSEKTELNLTEVELIQLKSLLNNAKFTNN